MIKKMVKAKILRQLFVYNKIKEVENE